MSEPRSELSAPPPGTERRLGLGGLVSLVGSSLSALTAMAVSIIVVRAVGPDGGGQFFQAVAIFSIAIAVLRLGSHTGLVRSISRDRAVGVSGGRTRTLLLALGPVVVVSSLASFGVFFAADSLAAWLATPEDVPTLTQTIRVMAPYIMIGAVLGVLHYAVRVMRGPVSFTLLQDIAMPVGRLTGVLAAAWFGWHAADLITAWLAALPLWILVTAGCLVRPIAADLRKGGLRRQVGQESAAGFWRFSGPRGVAVAVEIALEWSDVLIVAAIRSATEAGIYAVATRTVAAGRVVDQAARVAVSPSIAALLARGELDSVSRLHAVVTRVMVLIAWPYYLTLIVMGPAVMKIFGDELERGALVLSILGLAMLVVVTTGMLQSILLMGGKSSWQVGAKSFALILSLSLNLLLVPIHGIGGAAVTFAVVVIVDAGVAAVLVHVGMGVHLSPRLVLGSVLPPTLVFGGGGLVLRMLLGTSLGSLFVFLGVLGSCYLVVVWVLRHRLGLTGMRQLMARDASS